jgi:peptidoglycan/xylan/chitin deacetylase (PgdA/CDA1 family)
MQASGLVEFYSHTHTHPRLPRQATPEAMSLLSNDLALSQEFFVRHFGSASTRLAWPWGIWNAEYLTIAKAAGFKNFLTTQSGIWTPKTSSDSIPRINAKNRGALWFRRRLWIYSSTVRTNIYRRLHRG